MSTGGVDRDDAGAGRLEVIHQNFSEYAVAEEAGCRPAQDDKAACSMARVYPTLNA